MKDTTGAFLQGLVVAASIGALSSIGSYYYGRDSLVAEQRVRAEELSQERWQSDVDSRLRRYGWEAEEWRSVAAKVAQLETHLKTMQGVEEDAKADAAPAVKPALPTRCPDCPKQQ